MVGGLSKTACGISYRTSQYTLETGTSKTVWNYKTALKMNHWSAPGGRQKKRPHTWSIFASEERFPVLLFQVIMAPLAALHITRAFELLNEVRATWTQSTPGQNDRSRVVDTNKKSGTVS